MSWQPYWSPWQGYSKWSRPVTTKRVRFVGRLRHRPESLATFVRAYQRQDRVRQHLAYRLELSVYPAQERRWRKALARRMRYLFQVACKKYFSKYPVVPGWVKKFRV